MGFFFCFFFFKSTNIQLSEVTGFKVGDAYIIGAGCRLLKDKQLYTDVMHISI